MAIEVEKNIPLPERVVARTYPWAEMGVGDSFAVLAPQKQSGYNIAKAANYRLAPKRFKSGKDPLDPNKTRIWRIA